MGTQSHWNVCGQPTSLNFLRISLSFLPLLCWCSCFLFALVHMVDKWLCECRSIIIIIICLENFSMGNSCVDIWGRRRRERRWATSRRLVFGTRTLGRQVQRIDAKMWAAERLHWWLIWAIVWKSIIISSKWSAVTFNKNEVKTFFYLYSEKTGIAVCRTKTSSNDDNNAITLWCDCWKMKKKKKEKTLHSTIAGENTRIDLLASEFPPRQSHSHVFARSIASAFHLFQQRLIRLPLTCSHSIGSTKANTTSFYCAGSLGRFFASDNFPPLNSITIYRQCNRRNTWKS